MPKKASGNFDQVKYQNQWIKENMSEVRARYRDDFVDEFITACKKLGVSQSEVIKAEMEETIRKAEGK